MQIGVFFQQGRKTMNAITPNPVEPEPGMPPGWIPEPPFKEPEPDRLPDEAPIPNPDETRQPPKYARARY
jgi:hypothetical protein